MTTNKGKRMHIVAAWYCALDAIKSWIFPVVILVISTFSSVDHADFREIGWRLLLGILMVVFAGFFGWLQWLRFLYVLEDGQLKMQQGVLIRTQKTIPLERIQTVDITQKVIHRMTGTVRLQVQTSGGMKAEAVFSALSMGEGEKLRNQLLSLSQNHTKPENEPSSEVATVLPVREPQEHSPTYPLSWKRLLITGINTSEISLVIPVILGGLFQLSAIFPIDPFEVLFASSVFVLVASFILLVWIAWLVSVSISVLRFANYSIYLKGERLFIFRGLLEKKQVTIPLKRVQAIRLVEEPLWEWFGYVSVHMVTTGYGNSKGESSLLHPLLRRDELSQFLGHIVPAYQAVCTQPLHPLPSRSRRTYVIPYVCITLLVAFLVSTFFPPWGWVGLCLVVASVVLGLWQHHSSGWWHDERMLVLRTRRWNRETLLVPIWRIQTVQIVQTPWARKILLANLKLSLASSSLSLSLFPNGMYGLGFSLRGWDASQLFQWLAVFQQRNLQVNQRKKAYD
jgi:putative membrane protein